MSENSPNVFEAYLMWQELLMWVVNPKISQETAREVTAAAELFNQHFDKLQLPLADILTGPLAPGTTLGEFLALAAPDIIITPEMQESITKIAKLHSAHCKDGRSHADALASNPNKPHWRKAIFSPPPAEDSDRSLN